MAFLREIPKVKDPSDNKQLLNYIYALEEQLRYVYANLGAENLIDGAVGADQLKEGSITTEKIAAPAMKELKLQSQKAVRILAQDTDGRFGKVEASVDQVRLEVGNIEVGGANMLPDTKTLNGWAYNDSETSKKPVTVSTDNEGFAVAEWAASEESVGAALKQVTQIPYEPMRNKEVVLSFEWKSAEWTSGESMTIGFQTENSDGVTGRREISLAMEPAETWKKTIICLKMDDAFWGSDAEVPEECGLTISLTNWRLKGCQLRKLKMELGNKATDWTPAPADGAYTTSAVLDRSGIHLKTGGTFTVESKLFNVNEKGEMEATAGSIGGWEIKPGALSSGEGEYHVALNADPEEEHAMWAGGENAKDAKYRVMRDGTLYVEKLIVANKETEDSEEQVDTIDLYKDWWKVNGAVRTLQVVDGVLQIGLFNGKSVNFSKASDFDNLYVTAAGSGSNNVTMTATAVTATGETLGKQTITITQNIDAKRVVVGATGTQANGAYVDCTGIYRKGWDDCLAAMEQG